MSTTAPRRQPAPRPADDGTAHDSDPTTPVLELRDARRMHRSGGEQVAALDGVDLSVAAGEFVAITGPSGSGKSTLLHLAGGLASPDGGEVLVHGRSLATMSAAQRAGLRRTAIGYVFQELNLIPSLTAIENVSFPLELDGTGGRDAARQAAEALESLGIPHLTRRTPDQLSGGEAQRVAIARAVVGSRRLLLADEPTGALDSATASEVVALLRERADAGLAVVLVTHEARLAAWADRTVQLRDGRIVGRSAPFDPDSLLATRTPDGEPGPHPDAGRDAGYGYGEQGPADGIRP